MEIPKTTSIRDSGVLLDSQLNFNLHIENTVSNASRMLGLYVLMSLKSFIAHMYAPNLNIARMSGPHTTRIKNQELRGFRETLQNMQLVQSDGGTIA